MKRGSRKLLGLLIAGLLLGGFAAPAYAADPAEGKIYFNGYANQAGNPVQETGEELSIPKDQPIKGIDVTLNHNPDGSVKNYDYGTTAALVFSGKTSYGDGGAYGAYQVTGDIRVVNTNMGSDNNDAIYAKYGATVNIGQEGSTENGTVYLASIANSEKTITPPNMNALINAIKDNDLAAMIVAAGTMKNNSSVLAAKGGGGNNVINVYGKTVQLIGNLDFLGNGNGTGNTITAVLDGPDSFWYGDESNIPMSTTEISDLIEQYMTETNKTAAQVAMKVLGIINPGTLKVTLSDGAEWIYNANPSISALTLDRGIVNLQDEDIKSKYASTYIPDVAGQTISDVNGESYQLAGYRSNAPHTYVDIGTLSGSGIFKADIDWNAKSAKNSYKSVSALPEDMGSDYIFINNFDAESTRTRSSENEEMPMQTLSFDESKAHLEDMKAGDKLYFATVSGNTGFKTEHSVYSNAANVFNYHYQASGEPTSSEIVALSGNEEETEKSQNWYIEVTGKTAEDNANFTAARSLMEAGYAMGTELDTLNKRMGEARYLDSDQGLWVRYRHGRSSRDDSYKTDSDMLQLGYDRKTDAGNGTHHRGVAFDYTDADTSLYQLSGSGDVDRYALSLYDTWMGSKGHYYDFVIRGGRINSGYDISGRFSTGMESMDNSYHQWFGSVSFEYGRRKDMSGSWYIEPQAQLQLARIGGASFTSASGVRTELDGTTSLIGRAGFRLGREFGSDGSDRNTFYIKADILHEFAGDRGFTLTGNDGWYAQNDNGTDTWYDVGIGVDLSLGHSTYFWTDVERILGSDFDNTWQVSGGLRWKW